MKKLNTVDFILGKQLSKNQNLLDSFCFYVYNEMCGSIFVNIKTCMKDDVKEDLEEISVIKRVEID